MRLFLAYALCSAGMIGVYFLIHYAIFGVSADFGHGFFIGVAATVFLLWGADRIEKRRSS